MKRNKEKIGDKGNKISMRPTLYTPNLYHILANYIVDVYITYNMNQNCQWLNNFATQIGKVATLAR